MPELVLLRHGKSDWSARAEDHDRPLSSRGRRHAAVVGRVLARIGWVPPLALTSTARRAAATVEIAAEAGDWPTIIEPRPELYLPSVDGVLSVIAARARGVERILVAGHEPTWSSMVRRLTGASVRFPTAALAAIEVVSWEALDEGGELEWFLPPRVAERILDA